MTADNDPGDAFDEDAFDDIEDEDFAVSARTDAVTVDPYEPSVVETRHGVGLPVVLGASVLAALAGAAGGYGLAATYPPVEPPIAAVEAVRADLSAGLSGLDAEIASTTESVDALTQRLTRLESRPAPTLPAGELEALSTRIAELERSPSPIAPTIAGEDVPEADPGSRAPALTPALARRLSTLERRVEAIETAEPPAPDPTPALTATPASRPVAARPVAAPLPAYPFSAVESAITDAEPSTFRRVLRVRDRDTVEALTALREALADGDIDAALAAHARLPEAAQAEAADWERAARAAR